MYWPHLMQCLFTSLTGPAKRQKKDAGKRKAKHDEDTDADGSRTPATVSVEGFAVTWSLEAVYYLPMAELAAAPGCCALLSGVLQDPTAEKARLHGMLTLQDLRCTRIAHLVPM